MKMYHWNRSEMLRNYGAGNIIVIASSLDDARQKARESFKDWCRERYYYCFDDAGFYGDTDDADRIEDDRNRLEEDISKEPLIVSGAIFISGSE